MREYGGWRVSDITVLLGKSEGIFAWKEPDFWGLGLSLCEGFERKRLKTRSLLFEQWYSDSGEGIVDVFVKDKVYARLPSDAPMLCYWYVVLIGRITPSQTPISPILFITPVSFFSCWGRVDPILRLHCLITHSLSMRGVSEYGPWMCNYETVESDERHATSDVSIIWDNVKTKDTHTPSNTMNVFSSWISGPE